MQQAASSHSTLQGRVNGAARCSSSVGQQVLATCSGWPAAAAAAASNRVVQSLQSKIEFVADDSSGQMLVKVIDPSNNELIRQIPSEEMLAISRALDRMQGLLVKSQA
jgi:flagellar protein FlaG